MNLLSLLDSVKQAIYDNPDTPHQPSNDPGGLISGIENLFGQFGQNNGDRSVLPSSRDSYGDPADQGSGNVRPASQDPLGDPGG